MIEAKRSLIIILLSMSLIGFIPLFDSTNAITTAGSDNVKSNDIITTAPLYKIDLNKNPRNRWRDVALAYKNLTHLAIKQFIGTIPKELRIFASVAASQLDSLLPHDFGEEIRGIAEAIDAPLGDVVLLNIIYDVTAHCTGIIANDKHGGIWHGRNLDFGNTGNQTRILQASTIRVDFVRNGSLYYSSVTFAGYIGTLTGWKPNAFAITINERDKGSLGRNLLSAAIELLKGNLLFPVSMIARIALEQDAEFEAAKRRLLQTQLIAPVYYILSGNATDQGVVIVRDQYSVMGINELDQATGSWFVVQTNYDYWVTPPSTDDRRDAAIKAMQEIGQDHVNLHSVLQALSTNPVLNNHTAYTSVFSAVYANQSETVIRN